MKSPVCIQDCIYSRYIYVQNNVLISLLFSAFLQNCSSIVKDNGSLQLAFSFCFIFFRSSICTLIIHKTEKFSGRFLALHNFVKILWFLPTYTSFFLVHLHYCFILSLVEFTYFSIFPTGLWYPAFWENVFFKSYFTLSLCCFVKLEPFLFVAGLSLNGSV